MKWLSGVNVLDQYFLPGMALNNKIDSSAWNPPNQSSLWNQCAFFLFILGDPFHLRFCVVCGSFFSAFVLWEIEFFWGKMNELHKTGPYHSTIHENMKSIGWTRFFIILRIQGLCRSDIQSSLGVGITVRDKSRCILKWGRRHCHDSYFRPKGRWGCCPLVLITSFSNYKDGVLQSRLIKGNNCDIWLNNKAATTDKWHFPKCQAFEPFEVVIGTCD